MLNRFFATILVITNLMKHGKPQNQTIDELVKSHGYRFEKHHVTTTDGYILELHRIPYGLKRTPSKGVVFLQHGLLGSSVQWVLGPNHSLSFQLVDAGYDVWMGNNRGNTYSRKHVSLRCSEEKFWNFSFHELGVIDLPTMIDYVLEKTGQENLVHIGYSQGTTTFYVMGSEKPEYNKKIKLHVSLSPIAYLGHIESPLAKLASKLVKFPQTVQNSILGVGEFMAKGSTLRILSNSVCKTEGFPQKICESPMFLIFGYDKEQTSESFIPYMMSYLPSSASVKQILHYFQEIESGCFRQYDYGNVENLARYGEIEPPKYDLSKASAPVVLFYSRNDYLSSMDDVEYLSKQLPNVKEKILIKHPYWNHIDYVFAIDAKKYVYDLVLKKIAEYT